jgi:GDP-L-fucose synthase
MPTNMYGPNDNFDLATCHVLPALINRFVTAEINGDSLVTLWGTGLAKREFMYVDDFTSALFIAAERLSYSSAQRSKP